jgi:hypothetical protein
VRGGGGGGIQKLILLKTPHTHTQKHTHTHTHTHTDGHTHNHTKSRHMNLPMTPAGWSPHRHVKKVRRVDPTLSVHCPSQHPTRVHVAKQNISKRSAALHPSQPDVQNSRRVVDCVRRVDGAAASDADDERGARCRERFEKGELVGWKSKQSSRVRWVYGWSFEQGGVCGRMNEKCGVLRGGGGGGGGG